jgi:retron-type reverse transcriptase
MGFFSRLFGSSKGSSSGHTVDELARRLGVTSDALRAVRPQYTRFNIPKRTGGTREILAPVPELKKLQRQILRRVLAKLKAHPNVTGFERNFSIVSNAIPHVDKEMVIHLDLKDFFTSTSAKRIEQYFRAIGWSSEAAALLIELVTYKGALPQGAPTSPRLSNLVNFKMDERLAGLAEEFDADYTRYADDLTFSLNRVSGEVRANSIIHAVKEIARDEGYALHIHKKLRIARKHDRQLVTGLVVNKKVNLPRSRRRWLRAVEHHAKTGKPTTITPQQLEGWRSLQSMIKAQANE